MSRAGVNFGLVPNSILGACERIGFTEGGLCALKKHGIKMAFLKRGI